MTSQITTFGKNVKKRTLGVISQTYTKRATRAVRNFEVTLPHPRHLSLRVVILQHR